MSDNKQDNPPTIPPIFIGPSGAPTSNASPMLKSLRSLDKKNIIGSFIDAGRFTVRINSGILASLGSRIVRSAPAANYILIADREVAREHIDALMSSMHALNRRVNLKILPAGEVTRSRRTKEQIEDWMVTTGCTKNTCIISMGGKILQDVCGFIAVTYMMGLPLIIIPTTLDAMLECSLKRKIAIPIGDGKSVIGTEITPSAVFIDLQTLKNASPRQLRDGIALAIRTGIASDRTLFVLIDENAHLIQQYDVTIFSKVIHRALQGRVVLNNTKLGASETRRFGSTVGDAVSDLMSPMLFPGECLSIGIMVELELSQHLGHVSDSGVCLGVARRCLKKFYLPTRVPNEIVPADLIDAMRRLNDTSDSKDGTFPVVMVSGIGRSLAPDPIAMVKESAVVRILKSMKDAISLTPSRVYGSIRVPGSKSVSNRVLLMAALGKGTCQVKGLQLSDSTETMIAVLCKLGVKIEWTGETSLIVHGSCGKLSLPDTELYMGASSTATRFMTTAVNLIDQPGTVVITGNARMNERPITDLVDALNGSGCKIKYKSKAQLPLSVTVGRDKNGPIWRGGKIRLSANVSSQFVSSVLMSAPYAANPVTLTLEQTAGVSKQYIGITVSVMKLFGVEVKQISPNEFEVPTRPYTNPSVVTVEGDATAACYHLTLAAATGGEVKVENVGSSSMQNDARFCDILAKMGCKITQDKTSTIVTGPAPPPRRVDSEIDAASPDEDKRDTQKEEKIDEKKVELQALKEVNIADMPDIFATLAALATVARGSTKIVGISNQKYRESDRIEVMASSIRAVGGICDILQDGFLIKGDPMLRYRPVLERTVLSPHDDSRVAMSLAVIASVIPGVVIEGQSCVDDTYPNFWKDVEKLHLSIGPLVDTIPDSIGQKEATIFIVGMRGVGKTTLGKRAAKALGREFVDLDHFFEIRHGIKIREFVQKYSWREFRSREFALFKEVTRTHSRGCVVACGAGLVETPSAIEILKKLPVVVQIRRHVDDVSEYLNKSARPALLRNGQYAWDVKAIWKGRKARYHAASAYDFNIIKGDSAWDLILDDFVRFLCTVTLNPHSLPARSMNADIRDIKMKKLVGGTFFLSLTFKNMLEAVPNMQDLVAGNSAIELRGDLWESWDPDFIAEQIAIFRRHCCLPIVYTFRTIGQCGKFPEDESELFKLYHLGVRLGCEYVDMEHHWSRAARNRLLRHRRHAKIIASAHFKHSNGGTEADLENTFRLCAHGGRADVVKVVTTAFCLEDAIRLVHVAKNVRLPGNPPKIILAMGAVGQISRVFNEFLTPVTHALMPGIAAPGQLSIAEIMASRRMLSIRAPVKREMYVLGIGTRDSLAPLLLNTAFKYLHLQHEAKIFEAKDNTIDAIAKLLKSPNFGGASVSNPFKCDVIPLLTHLSKSAKAVGAVNVISVMEHKNGLFGHNTDYSSFLQKFKQERLKTSGRAIVMGSLGSARAAVYALILLGYKRERVIVCDPLNTAKAEGVATHFGCISLSMEDIKNVKNINAVIVTYPRNDKQDMGDFVLPLSVVQQRPLVIDSRYYPLHTKVEQQAAVYGCNTLRGLDLLIAQSISALKLWVNTEHWAMVESAAPVIDLSVRHLFYEKYVCNNESK
ncbi:hypothetical protein AAMO2058_000722500 [Amorphochlora amoebiformis]